MDGFGIHSSIWTMDWTPQTAEHAVAEAVRYKFDFIEIAVLNPSRASCWKGRACRLWDRLACPKAAGCRATRTRGSIS